MARKAMNWHRTANTSGSNREKQTFTAGDRDEAMMHTSTQPKHKAMCLHTKQGSVMILPQEYDKRIL